MFFLIDFKGSERCFGPQIRTMKQLLNTLNFSINIPRR
jgi:hypothetical protein